MNQGRCALPTHQPTMLQLTLPMLIAKVSNLMARFACLLAISRPWLGGPFVAQMFGSILKPKIAGCFSGGRCPIPIVDGAH